MINLSLIENQVRVPPRLEPTAQAAIQVKNLGKCYHLYQRPMDRLMQFFYGSRTKIYQEHWAVKDMTFEIRRGEAVGIIGLNGSGKSTLLGLLHGTLSPTCGSVSVCGKVSALLDLGSGFNPDFTGRENVIFNAEVLGLDKHLIKDLMGKIEPFAEIGSFIDQPVKTYSSGMLLRLAFSVLVSMNLDILVVDEALAVGDMFFQHRCLAKMEEFKEQGKTIILVTHDLNLVKSFCHRAILMDQGSLVQIGEPELVTERYMMLVRQRQTQNAPQEFKVVEKKDCSLSKIGFGSEKGQILDVSVLDKNFERVIAVKYGDLIHLRVSAFFDQAIKNPNVEMMLRDETGYFLYGIDTVRRGMILNLTAKNGRVDILFSFFCIFVPSTYSFSIRLEEFFTPEVNLLLDKKVGVGTFQVVGGNTKFLGKINLDAKVESL